MVIQFSQSNKAAAAGVISTHYRLSPKEGEFRMSLTPILPHVAPAAQPHAVPPFVATIDPLRGLTLSDGRRLTLRWAHDLRQFGQDALAEMQLTIDEAQQLLEAETVIEDQMEATRDANKRSTAYLDQPPWLGNRPRFARSSSRRRKSAANCLRCIYLGAKCWQHGGGK